MGESRAGKGKGGRRTTGRGGGLTYADSGVDIEAGDRFAESIQAGMRRTFGPRVLDRPGGFAGLVRLDYNESLFKHNYKDPVLVSCTDGVGTKVHLGIELEKYDTLGIDLVAMCVNDLVVESAEPLLFLDYIAVNRVDQGVLSELMKGIVRGCEIAGAALIGGETAEMNDLYRPGDFDLAGFSVGVVELSRATDATRVEPGDVVLGLASDGVHSNGFSLVRKIVEHANLDLGRVYPELAGDNGAPETLGEVLLTPTRIYARSIVRVLRAYKVKKVVTGMAHITGGGLASNLERALPEHVDAVVRADAWDVPPVFPFLQRHGDVSDEEMARVFNMGVGYCLIVRPTFADSIAKRLEKQGERVYHLGKITKGKGRVRIKA
ncbi:MAG: phosphoribosylformylglycinamidine cyclo-ligase [Phycisphaerales bacterium JB059]